MPKYTFKCSECNTIEQQFVPRSIKEVPCRKCAPDKEVSMTRLPPQPLKAEVDETIDKFFNVKQSPDQSEMVQQRRDEYYWTVEVPRLVNSGTYSVETMLEMNWIYLDDKDQVQINTTPPHKR